MKKKKEEFYYKNLCSAMEYAYQAAQFLTETLKHFDKESIQEKLDAMHELEQKGDVKKHKMMKALSQAFITPIEREDLVSLSGYIDDIIEPDATRKRVIAAFDMLSTKNEERPYKKHGAV